MNFQRFEHVNQLCKDIAATKQFYQTLFPDWYVRAEGEDSGWRWMHLGNHQFYLALNQPPQSEHSDSTGHVDHIGFVIKDGEAIKAVLEQHNIPYEVYRSPETKTRIYVTDPDGTELEFVEYQADYALK